MDEPLTNTVLSQLNLTPFAEEVLMELESYISLTNLEAEKQNQEIAGLERKLESLKPYLGCGDAQREETYWQLYKDTKQQLDGAKSRTAKADSTDRLPIGKGFSGRVA